MLNKNYKMLEITSANQDVFMDLNDEDAQTISGGATEVFTVRNRTSNANINYFLDGKASGNQGVGSGLVWTAYSGGIIHFDADTRGDVYVSKKYDLSNGRIYEFRDDPTPGNPYDIELYTVA